MKSKITWIVVANGAQARIYENSGPGKGMEPVAGLDFSIPALQAQEIASDRPGRSHSVSPGRSAMEPQTDPVEHREAEFVKSVARVLDEKAGERAFDRLIIAAAPIALGTIRPALTKRVRDTILAELPKDLTNIPKPSLATHFEDVLAV